MFSQKKSTKLQVVLQAIKDTSISQLQFYFKNFQNLFPAYSFAFEIPKIKLPQNFNVIRTQGNLEAFHKPKKKYLKSLEIFEFLYQRKPIEAAFLKFAKIKKVQAPLYEC